MSILRPMNIRLLNELEYIKGFVYSNIWPTSTIVKIDLTDGRVLGKLNLDSLVHDAKKPTHCCLMILSACAATFSAIILQVVNEPFSI